jgi:hypothetical protein
MKTADAARRSSVRELQDAGLADFTRDIGMVS